MYEAVDQLHRFTQKNDGVSEILAVLVHKFISSSS